MFKLLENDKQFLNELKTMLLKEKAGYEEDDFMPVPMKKVKCRKLLGMYKQANKRSKKLFKYMEAVAKKHGRKSPQFERAEEHYEHAREDERDFAIAYEKQCKKEAPYYG